MTQIPMSGFGQPEPKGRLPWAMLSSRALDRMPPAALLLLAVVSIQLSSAFATFLFSSLGPAGTSFLTAFFSGAVLMLMSRPKIDRRLREGAWLILLFGLADACQI